MPSLADLFLACKRFRLLDFPVLFFEFGRFRDLTCDFWAESAEKMQKQRQDQSLRPSGFAPAFGREVGRFAAGIDAGLKRRSTWMQRQVLGGVMTVCIPPIAKCAMDGAPGDGGLGDGRTGNGKCNRRSFDFAAHKVL